MENTLHKENEALRETVFYDQQSLSRQHNAQGSGASRQAGLESNQRKCHTFEAQAMAKSARQEPPFHR